MPWTKAETLRIFASMAAPSRRLAGSRRIERTVQGVRLSLPRSHLLPVYARVKPSYGQNLVQLAAGLAAPRPADGLPLRVLDIGANIGDSALQIAAASGAEVLCVEGDPYWVGYLHDNVDGNPAITVEEVLLVPEDRELPGMSPVRDHGTTRFVEGGPDTGGLPASTATELRRRHPGFDRLRLVKSDTDGFDPVLVPAAARAWADSGPVLFFEFDPELARKAGNPPNHLWSELAALGYARLAVWDNSGDPLGQLDVGDAPRRAGTLEPKPVELGYHFWDVAACRADDDPAIRVFDELVPMAFDPLGTRRPPASTG
ncbi:MAG TPA: FkbM family methyltransferase [Acidimicrobiales bacterium]|nr:FkbM family methyltransferase [Acidimicrobiales bacterium]